MSIPLRGAMFCLDCDAVTEMTVVRTLNGNGGRRIVNICGYCGGRAVWPLQAWLEPESFAAKRARSEIKRVVEVKYLEKLLKQK